MLWLQCGMIWTLETKRDLAVARARNLHRWSEWSPRNWVRLIKITYFCPKLCASVFSASITVIRTFHLFLAYLPRISEPTFALCSTTPHSGSCKIRNFVLVMKIYQNRNYSNFSAFPDKNHSSATTFGHRTVYYTMLRIDVSCINSWCFGLDMTYWCVTVLRNKSLFVSLLLFIRLVTHPLLQTCPWLKINHKLCPESGTFLRFKRSKLFIPEIS